MKKYIITFFIVLMSIQVRPVLSSELMSNAFPNKDLISLNLQGVDIIEVLKILSSKGDLNVVIGSNVRGRVTMFLNNVTIESAFYNILKASSLACVKEDEIMKIMTEKEYEALYGQPFFNNKNLFIISLKNANAVEVSKSIVKLKTGAVIVVDERTNSLLVKDSQKNIEEIKSVVNEMDKQIVTKNYSIKHLSKDKTESLVKILIGKKGAYYFNSDTNQLVIKDYPEKVNKIIKLLNSQDIPTKLITKSFELDYAKFDELEAKLKQILTPDIGSVISDERTNKILVSDVPSKFEKIELLISEYDTKDRQVLIEAKIVQVILNDRFQWGINWQSVIENINDSSMGLRLMSAFDIAENITQGIGFAESVNSINKVGDTLSEPSDTTTTETITNTDSFGKTTTTSNTTRTKIQTNERIASDNIPFNSNISYPNEGGARIIASGTIDGRQFEGVLNALKLVGDTKVLSSPRIIAMNKKTAKIQVASKEAYVTSTTVTPGSGPSTTSENVTFIDVGINLEVTPQINKESFVTLNVKPSVSSVTSFVQTASGNQVPIVSTQEVESTIQVKDGATIVLGGIHEQLIDEVESRVPFLGAIPLLGNLFKKIDNRKRNSELVMFLTPHIVNGDKSFYENEEAQKVSKNMKGFLAENDLYSSAREYELEHEKEGEE